MVLGGDSCSLCHEFESQHQILDGHFSHLSQKLFFLFEKTENNEKEAEDDLLKNVLIRGQQQLKMTKEEKSFFV